MSSWTVTLSATIEASDRNSAQWEARRLVEAVWRSAAQRSGRRIPCHVDDIRGRGGRSSTGAPHYRVVVELFALNVKEPGRSELGSVSLRGYRRRQRAELLYERVVRFARDARAGRADSI